MIDQEALDHLLKSIRTDLSITGEACRWLEELACESEDPSGKMRLDLATLQVSRAPDMLLKWGLVQKNNRLDRLLCLLIRLAASVAILYTSDTAHLTNARPCLNHGSRCGNCPKSPLIIQSDHLRFVVEKTNFANFIIKCTKDVHFVYQEMTFSHVRRVCTTSIETTIN